MEARIDKANMNDVLVIARNLRDSDIEEIKAGYGDNVIKEVLKSYTNSTRSWIAYADDIPVAVFGVSQHPEDKTVGVPWMVGTNDLNNHLFKFLKYTRAIISMMGSQFDYLMNYTSVDNEESQKLLHWLGFDFCDAEEFGEKKALFYPFIMRTS